MAWYLRVTVIAKSAVISKKRVINYIIIDVC